jgi:hypothetical protein
MTARKEKTPLSVHIAEIGNFAQVIKSRSCPICIIHKFLCSIWRTRRGALVLTVSEVLSCGDEISGLAGLCLLYWETSLMEMWNYSTWNPFRVHKYFVYDWKKLIFPMFRAERWSYNVYSNNCTTGVLLHDLIYFCIEILCMCLEKTL